MSGYRTPPRQHGQPQDYARGGAPYNDHDDDSLPGTPRQAGVEGYSYNYALDAVPLSPGLPSHPIAPDAQAYIRETGARPSAPVRRPSAFTFDDDMQDYAGSEEKKPSFLEELLPTPTVSAGTRGKASRWDAPAGSVWHVLRRTGSLAVVVIFLLSTVFLACTDAVRVGDKRLRLIFGEGAVANVVSGGTGWVAQDMSKTNETTSPEQEFEQYTMLRTLDASAINVSHGKRLIFIGDIHGSYDPLQRLLDKIHHDESTDTIIHVGDLVAKGEKNNEVLDWMSERGVYGVRGNHDQPALQWRAWMLWAGGGDWEAYIDSLAGGGEDGVRIALKKAKKMFPKDWQWKGEHWHIARNMRPNHYAYLQQLPLTLHLPSLHSIVVHAGLLPSDPRKSASDPNQPLVDTAQSASSPNYNAELARHSEELSILLDVPQNTQPWNLLNMRGVYTKGKKKGKITKSGKRGTPWSDVWKKEMGRCKGRGTWWAEGMGELGVEGVHDTDEDAQAGQEQESDELGEQAVDEFEDDDGDDQAKRRRSAHRQSSGSGAVLAHAERAGTSAGTHHARANDEEEEEEGDDEDALEKIECSPVTVIYGHAAGRGLDIKPFSKGIDTGCVYGRQLTALVLGDIRKLKGKPVRVGDHQGMLVSVDCQKGGL